MSVRNGAYDPSARYAGTSPRGLREGEAEHEQTRTSRR